MRSIVLMIPGRLGTLTGGYIYDRRIVEGLRARGWAVDVRELDESFPDPTSAAYHHAARVFTELPDRAVVIVDGLAGGAMPGLIERETTRLRIVALVHHPLAGETGIEGATAARLMESERRTLAAVRIVVVTSTATASVVTGYGVSRDRIAVVEPGTDRAPLAAGSRSTPCQLLCVAALIPRKGHGVLLRALSAVPIREWRLACVGSIERDSMTVRRFREDLRTLGLEDRVSLRGEVDEAALAHCYDAADLFVLATEYEGYGMAVAEAVARGLPVISTPTGAIPDLVGDTAGMLVPPGNAEALAAALTRVLGDSRLRERLRHGARLARERLPPWESAVGQMASVLERLDCDLQR
jgi:glycosyltransferase involved in cell wall biosynthesis